jgi:hypothetical protein
MMALPVEVLGAWRRVGLVIDGVRRVDYCDVLWLQSADWFAFAPPTHNYRTVSFILNKSVYDRLAAQTRVTDDSNDYFPSYRARDVW